MPKWYVELQWGDHWSQDKPALSFLASHLQEPSSSVIEKDGKYYWLSSDFDSFTIDALVYRYAQERISLLNSIIKIKAGNSGNDIKPIEIGDIYQMNSSGQLTRDSVMRTLVGYYYPDENVLQTANTYHPNIKEIWYAIRNYPEVEEAMRYYAGSSNWYNLYKAYEVVRKDVTDTENNHILPANTFTSWTHGRKRDFEQSAHNYQLSGFNARHSSAGTQPSIGITPMSIKEAYQFVTDLLLEWLKTKP